MTQKVHSTEAFRQQALAKVYARGDRSVKAIAEELNINHWTLKNWMKAAKRSANPPATQREQRPNDWKPAERLDALLQTHGLDEQALGAWCREHGLFTHHLKQWQAEFESGARVSTSNSTELNQLKASNKQLERELRRKEKALAETAALLVLQKKYQALWEEKDA